jgi:hypothetical protein
LEFTDGIRSEREEIDLHVVEGTVSRKEDS